jgi:hypothetical protein
MRAMECLSPLIKPSSPLFLLSSLPSTAATFAAVAVRHGKRGGGTSLSERSTLSPPLKEINGGKDF